MFFALIRTELVLPRCDFRLLPAILSTRFFFAVYSSSVTRRKELAKFMYKLYNNNLLIVFQNRFTKIEKIHAYVTREANKSNYFLSRVNKTVGQNKLEYRGVKLWNQISKKLKCKSFNLFKKLYKEFLLSVHLFK